MINNNLDNEKNSNNRTATVTVKPNRITSKEMQQSKFSGSNMNRNEMVSSSTVDTDTPSNPSTNDNSYFNRFDNRIAANLAAVINGSRFRSSSCSKPNRSKPNQTKSFNNSENINTRTNTNGKTINSNSTRLNANSIASNSITNLHFGTVGNIGNTPSSLKMPQNYRFSSVTTLGGTRRRQQNQSKHKHFQLNNVDGNCSRPNSPHSQCNRNDGNSIAASISRQRPSYLFNQVNLNCNDNEKVAQTPSSDEDNSPTELNNCKRLADKPPLVKRLTMGLLRSHEESRPLVNAATPTIMANDELMTTTSTTIRTTTTTSTAVITTNAPQRSDAVLSLGEKHALYSYGYINEEAFEPEKFIASKFGDSCRQSLTAIPMLDTLNLNDNSEFNLKKRYLRETSSANSSPKIFGNRLRGNATTTGLYNSTVAGYASNNVNRTCSSSIDDDEMELKDACWFQAGISREIAAEVLSSKSPGAFLVRKSTSKSGCYALTLRIPSPPGPKIANYIILKTSRGYKINGFRKEFSTLKALITHHSVMPELLPIPLAMPRPTNMTSSRRNLDDFDTYDSLQMLLKYLRAKNLENNE